MAFQIPLMRNDFDIYKMNSANGKSRSIPAKQGNGRSRKASETHSLSTSPGTNDAFVNSPSHRNLHHVSSAGSRYQFSRVNSRNSQSSLITSPTRSQYANNTSPPKPAKVGSQNSLNKFHSRLVDRLRKAFKSSGSSSDDSRSWKSHSVDLSSPFTRPQSENSKKASASSAAITALEQQFHLMEMNTAFDSEEQSEDEDDNQRCDEKFILIWIHFDSVFTLELDEKWKPLRPTTENIFLHNRKSQASLSSASNLQRLILEFQQIALLK